MKTPLVEQLQTLLDTEDPAERKTAVLHWWHNLNQEEQEAIRDDVLSFVQQVAEFWIPIATPFGAAGQKALEIWQGAIEADPEFRAYIAALGNEQPANA